MSKNTLQAKIRANPKFAEMVKKRTRLAIVLSLVVLLPYYTFMLLTSLKPQLFTATLSETSVITIGWPIAALIVVGGWLMTGIYIRRANGEFDTLNAQILEEARK